MNELGTQIFFLSQKAIGPQLDRAGKVDSYPVSRTKPEELVETTNTLYSRDYVTLWGTLVRGFHTSLPWAYVLPAFIETSSATNLTKLACGQHGVVCSSRPTAPPTPHNHHLHVEKKNKGKSSTSSSASSSYLTPPSLSVFVSVIQVPVRLPPFLRFLFSGMMKFIFSSPIAIDEELFFVDDSCRAPIWSLRLFPLWILFQFFFLLQFRLSSGTFITCPAHPSYWSIA